MTDVMMEEVARNLELVMVKNLNDTIDDVWEEMAIEDAAYFAALEESVPTTPKPYPAKYFLGHHPSILERPIEDYPNLTIVSYEHRSMLDQGADQYEVIGTRAYVEAYVLHQDEDTINRIAWRYAKAIHRVVTLFKDLADSDVEPITSSPQVDISMAATRRLSEWAEDIVFIQGCRLEYVFQSQSPW